MPHKRFIKRFEQYILRFSTEEKKQIVNMLFSENVIFIPQSDNTFDAITKDEVVYIEQIKAGKIYIQTLNKKIDYCNTSCNILEYSVSEFDGFMYMTHSLVVNVEKMQSFNSYLRKIYFVNDIEVSVTRAGIDIAQKVLGKCNDLQEDTIFGSAKYIF